MGKNKKAGNKSNVANDATKGGRHSTGTNRGSGTASTDNSASAGGGGGGGGVGFGSGVGSSTGPGTSSSASAVGTASSSLVASASNMLFPTVHTKSASSTTTGTTTTATTTMMNSSSNTVLTWATPFLSPEAISKYETTRVHWVVACILLGLLLGYAMGAGWTELSGTVSPWRKSLGKAIRSSTAFRLITLQPTKWEELVLNIRSDVTEWAAWTLERTVTATTTNSANMNNNDFSNHVFYERNPSHPRTFALLREAIIREKGGFVHPDLGFLSPAPCGSIRGLGMVSDTYFACQTRCMPGSASERWELYKLKLRQDCDGRTCTNSELLPIYPNDADQLYETEEVLLRVPLSYQITRSVALATLTSLIPPDVQTSMNFAALDDAALLVLFLAHERGVGFFSKWYPYILSLPHQPSCGYSPALRPHMLDAIEAMRHELGMDVEGWPTELVKASMYADRIATALAQDYGPYLKTSPDVHSILDNIKWALCQVSSRGIVGDEKHGGGSLRMVPLMDLINHDANSGGFVELAGTEAIAKGDFLDAVTSTTSSSNDDDDDTHNDDSNYNEEDDKDAAAGTFVVRSMRHGRKRPLRKGQELLANYNVLLYTPLDWFVSMGFVPPERWGPWEKVDPVLPRVRRDGPFSDEVLSSRASWEKDASSVLKKIQKAEEIWSSQ